MINMESVRRLLAIADASKDPYAVTEVAGSLLAANGSDSVAAGHYVRALSALQLFGAAHRVVGGPPPAHGAGIVRWASRARRFAANLAALEVRDPHGVELVREAAKELDRYELHTASDGNFQVLDTTQPIHAGWLGTFTNHKATERLWQFDAAKCPVPFPIVFEGVGFGWLLLHVLKTTERSYLSYSCAVYVVDADPLALAMLLHLHDLQEIIRESRVRWFVRGTPEEALAAFRKALEESKEWTVPEQWVRCALRPSRAVSVEATMLEIAAVRRRRNEGWAAEAKAYYAGKDVSYWQRRYEQALSGEGEPLRVLGLTSRYTTVLQHSMTEMQAALRAAGHEMIVAMEPDDHSVENPYLELLTTYKPDLLFQISRMRYENPAMPREIPFVCWDQDNLPCMRTAAATEGMNALTYVAGHGATFGYCYLNWPRESCIFCHPAGATFRYSDEPAERSLLEKHACDISFISNASATPEELRNQQAQRCSREPRLHQIFQKCADRILAEMDAGRSWEYQDIEKLVQQSANEIGESITAATLGELAMALAPVADRCFRHAALHWARRWCEANGKTLRLYGTGWERHPAFAKYAAGPASQGDEVRAIYQASRINLQLIEGGFLHSRSLDGLAAGGFFLTRASANDGRGEEVAHAMVKISRTAKTLGLRTRRELENSPDPRIQAAYRTLSPHFQHMELDAEIQGLEIWCEVPHVRVVIPQYRDISFRSEEEFGRLAQRYLADNQLRRSLTAEMREVVVRDLSYSRRWEQFVAAIVAGLGRENRVAGTAQPALVSA